MNPSEFRELIKASIKEKIRKEAHFSICPINEYLTAANFNVRNQDIPFYNELSALHCVDYKSMTKELQNGIEEAVDFILTYKP